MNAKRLLAWGDLEAKRRRLARSGWVRLPHLAWALIIGVIAALELMRRLGHFGPMLAADATLTGASKLYLVAVVGAQTAVIFGGPFRLFWRHDAAILSRLELPGHSLFQVGLVRSVRAAGRILVASLIAACAFALDPDLDIALRHLAIACSSAIIAGFLGPATTLWAGSLVASNKLAATLNNVSGEVNITPSTFLGMIPGTVGASLALFAIALAPWARGVAETTIVGAPLMLLSVATIVPVIAIVYALRSADRYMPSALREVVALDRERLAHIDLVQPTAIDRLAMRTLLAGHDGAAIVFGKDARLTRRRYPIPFFIGVSGLVTLFILAATQPDDLVGWAAAVSAGVAVYGVIMARRLLTAPTEHMRFLRSLPSGPHGAMRAKRARALLWIGCYIVPGAIAVVARAPEPVSAAVTLGITVIAAAGLTLTTVRTNAS